jgi:hypothetical protein
LWNALYEGGADVILSGHDHDYERFAPQTPRAKADSAFGIREFVVGTGGRSHYAFAQIKPNSQVRNDDTFGVLLLTLHAASYGWKFVPEAGRTFTDSGSGSCHAQPGAPVLRLRGAATRLSRSGSLHVRALCAARGGPYGPHSPSTACGRRSSRPRGTRPATPGARRSTCASGADRRLLSRV